MRDYSQGIAARDNRCYDNRRAVRAAAISRRQAERNRRRILITLTFAVMMVSVFFFGTVKAKAASKPVHTYYAMHEVQPGDTFWGIAEEYTKGSDYTVREYVDALKKLNHNPDGSLIAGEKITVICFTTETN